MKKIISLALLLLISGCSFSIPSGSHKFVVVSKYIYEESDYARYKVEMPDNTRIGETSFYFADKKDKFNVGDVLFLQKQE